jgi:SPOR domain
MIRLFFVLRCRSSIEQRTMTTRPKHPVAKPAASHASIDTTLSAGDYRMLDQRARPQRAGGVRPGQERFDPRAWRETVKEGGLAHETPPVLDRPAADRQTPNRSAAPQRNATPNVAPAAGPLQGREAAPIVSRHAPLVAERAGASMQFSQQAGYSEMPRGILQAAPKREAGAQWRYLAVWAVLGSVSAAYVAGMAWQRTANFNMVIAPVTESLERMAGDIADLKQVTTAIDARERATADRVASAESRLSRFAEAGLAGAAAVAAVPSGQVSGQLSGQLSGQRPTNRAVLAEELPPSNVVPVEASKPQRYMAGVVLAAPGTPPGLLVGPAPQVQAPPKPDARATAAAAKAAGANPVKTGGLPEAVPAATARRQAGLLVASGPSLDAMRLSWSVLSQNHGGALGPVEPRVQQAGDGSIFQLIAGPYASDADAAKACSSLRARGVTCRMADFGGAAL